MLNVPVRMYNCTRRQCEEAEANLDDLVGGLTPVRKQVLGEEARLAQQLAREQRHALLRVALARTPGALDRTAHGTRERQLEHATHATAELRRQLLQRELRRRIWTQRLAVSAHASSYSTHRQLN